MRGASQTSRWILAGLLATIVVGTGRVPTADASPSSHTNATDHAAHMLAPARTRPAFRAPPELAASRAPGQPRGKQRPTDPANDARGAQAATASPASIIRVSKARRRAQHLSHGSTAFDRADDFFSVASALLRIAADVGCATSHAVFHDAHAPPFLS